MKERSHLDDLSIDRNLVLKLILEEWVGRVCLTVAPRLVSWRMKN